MYREAILDHYRNPKHFGKLDPHTVSHTGENPLCGDVLEVTLTLDSDDLISDCRFQGQGCAIAQAAADILLGHLKGRPVQDALRMDRDEMVKLLGVPVSPVRVKCAVLALTIVKDGLKIHRGEMPRTTVTRMDD